MQGQRQCLVCGKQLQPPAVRFDRAACVEEWVRRHRETGRCAFCEQAGPLHLPAEALWEATP